MSEKRYVLGFDPGFASFGYAVAVLQRDSIAVERMGVFRTKKRVGRQHVYEVEDVLQRCMELAQEIHLLIDTYTPVAVCAEALSYPRSSSVAAKIAMAWGVLAAECGYRKIPIFQLLPGEIRKRLLNVRAAPKERVQAELQRLFPKQDCEEFLAGIPSSEREHPWDALACLVACLDAAPIAMVRQMLACEE